MKTSHQVLELVSTGLSNKEISQILFISESGVKYHISNFFRRYSLKSRGELIARISDIKKDIYRGSK